MPGIGHYSIDTRIAERLSGVHNREPVHVADTSLAVAGVVTAIMPDGEPVATIIGYGGAYPRIAERTQPRARPWQARPVTRYDDTDDLQE